MKELTQPELTRPNLLALEDLPPAPVQRRSRERRERLMAAGLELFGERGYAGTSIDDVAERAQLSVGSFYQHFRSKRQLLLALMDDLLERLSQVRLEQTRSNAGEASSLPPSPEQIREGIREVLRRSFAHDLHSLGAYRAWQEAVLSDAGLRAKQEAIHEWTTARVRRVFERLQMLPGARREVDAASLARVMDGFFWSLLAQAVHMPRVKLDQWVDMSTHLIFHGLFVDG